MKTIDDPMKKLKAEAQQALSTAQGIQSMLANLNVGRPSSACVQLLRQHG